MLDGSDSVKESIFENLRSFLSVFCEEFNISKSKVQIGFSTIPYPNKNHFFFNETTNTKDFQDYLSTVTKPQLRKFR